MTLLQDEAPKFKKHEPKDHTLNKTLTGKPDAMLHAQKTAAAIAKERSLTRRLWEPCCANEKRSMRGGCLSCGDPCF